MSKELNLNKAFNRTFGVEIEMCGITREQAARICASVMGEGSRVEYTGQPTYRGGDGYSCWSCFDPSGRKWKFVSDCSIRADHDHQCELNTPPLTYAKDMEDLQALVRALRRAGAKTGAEYDCGIHIHVDGHELDFKAIKNLVNMFYSRDELLRKSLGVDPSRSSRWCKPIGDDLVNAFKPCRNIEQLEDAWYSLYARYQNRSDHYNDSRYHILNLHRYFSTRGKACNTVEVRAFNASLHAGVVRSYVLLILTMVEAALELSRIYAKKNFIMQAGNEKFAMRTWLVDMGWTGDMFDAPKKHLVKHLTGCAAWRFGENFDQYLVFETVADAEKMKEKNSRNHPNVASYEIHEGRDGRVYMTEPVPFCG